MKSKGKLVRWNSERGFGFIKSSKISGDVFIHISELKQMSRKPIVNDIIYFDLVTENDGKNKAIHASIEGVPIRSTQPRNNKRKEKNSIVSILLTLIITSAVLFGAYKTYPLWSSKIIESVPVNLAITEDFTGYQCEGKQYCSQMTSCKEARFYLKNCPNVKIDGNNDGIPCESQWCN